MLPILPDCEIKIGPPGTCHISNSILARNPRHSAPSRHQCSSMHTPAGQRHKGPGVVGSYPPSRKIAAQPNARSLDTLGKAPLTPYPPHHRCPHRCSCATGVLLYRSSPVSFLFGVTHLLRQAEVISSTQRVTLSRACRRILGAKSANCFLP